mgnify:FL=1
MVNNSIPRHVAIIMDGNGTWAKKRGLPRNMGHRKGAKTLVDITKAANELKIEYLTVFAFSTENWSRPKEEVEYLMSLPQTLLSEYKDDMKNDNIKFKVIGSHKGLSLEQIEKIEEAERETANNTGLNLIVAFNYGSQDEIIEASKNIVNDVLKNKLNLQDLTKEKFSEYLYTKDIPSVDLLIRTSGQYRISNFLLWQISYSELYFTKTLWPDFKKKDLEKAILSYKGRDRRFGGIKKWKNVL